MHKNKFYVIGRTGRGISIHDDNDHQYQIPIQRRHKFISLFSGAMGLDLGLESAGFESVCCLELDKWACATVKKNRPALPLIQDDIRNWNGPKILAHCGQKREDISLVVGGPPCPSFSTAGKRQAFNDPRGQVMFDFLRIVDEIRPPFFVMENVRGILSAALEHTPLAERKSKDASEFGHGSVMRMLNDTFKKMGYTVTVELVNAANYGVPQKRERVVFLGSRDGFQVTMPVPAYAEGGNFFQARWRTLGDAVKGLNDAKPEYIQFSKSRLRFLELLTEGQNWRNLPPELMEEALGGAYDSSGGRVGFYRRLSFDEPSPTVPTSPGQKSTCLCHPTELRPLSVREYARIQQFPDDWVFVGGLAQKYRQIGNAVPVGLGNVIGLAVKRFLQNYEKL